MKHNSIHHNTSDKETKTHPMSADYPGNNPFIRSQQQGTSQDNMPGSTQGPQMRGPGRPSMGPLRPQQMPPMGPPRPPQGPPMGPPRPPQGPPMGPPRPPQGPPVGAPGMGQPPRNPPPSFTPEAPGVERRMGGPEQRQEQFGIGPQFRPGFRVRPRELQRCINRFTFIWLFNGNNFWFYPTFVDRQFVQGFRWRRNRWDFDRIDLRRIFFFRCF